MLTSLFFFLSQKRQHSTLSLKNTLLEKPQIWGVSNWPFPKRFRINNIHKEWSIKFRKTNYYMGAFKNDATRVSEEGGILKISDKKWHREEGWVLHANSDTNTKKICTSFYFLLDFGQRDSSWALVTIPVGVPFQALAWVLVCWLNKA